MAALHPLGDRLLVKRSCSVEQTERGIFLPSGSREKPCKGIVVRCGSSVTRGNCSSFPDLREGSKILFSSNFESSVEFEGEIFLILSVKDVLGIFLDESSIV